MKYLIGMDGGGTKTACVATDLDGNILHKCSGGPSNFLIIGTEKVSETLYSLISECKEKLNATYEDFGYVVIGTTGAGRRIDADRLQNAFTEYCAAKNYKVNFYVDSDARIALEGAFSGKPGSIMIAGTGSIMFGKDAEGKIHRVGGFGRFLGDQGSGYSIGRQGLTMLGKHFDERGHKTTLAKLVAEKFDIKTQEELIIQVYKNNFDIASAAPLVIQSAEQGDEVCHHIVEDESYELVLHILAMLKKLNLPVLDLSLIGSLITTDNFFARTFKEKVVKFAPNVNIKEADYPPAMGAIFLAKEKIKG